MKLDVGSSRAEDDTNILDVYVPPEMRIRHRCSIGWVNDAFAGGWIASSVNMLTGDPGAGKTTLVLQLADSLTAMGHTVLYNTREEDKVQVKMKVEQLNLRHGFIISQHSLTKDLLKHTDRLIAKKQEHIYVPDGGTAVHPGEGKLFLFQDSLPTLDDGFYRNGVTNSRTPERCAVLLTNWAKKTRSIVLFINHVTKNGQFVGKNTVKHAIDAHAHIKVNKKTGLREFTVTKNRFGACHEMFFVGMGADGLQLAGRRQDDASEEESNVIQMSEHVSKKRRRRRRRARA